MGKPEAGSRGQLTVALCAVLVVSGPFLCGGGIDLTDDALYGPISTWEWLRFASSQGLNPYWVPGSLGGASLFSGVVPMGPFYPAAWLLAVLPVWLALPVAMCLHALLVLLAVRWLALVFGASRSSATLAGAGVCLGTVGSTAFIDLQVDTIAVYLWFPVLLGASERLHQSSEPAHRLRWAAVAAGALTLLLLGSHLRWAAACCAAWGLWVFVRGLGLRWAVLISVLALAAGAPGYVPYLEHLRDLHLVGDRLSLLSLPPHERFSLWNLPGWLVAKTSWFGRDFSAGALLGVASLVALRHLEGRHRRLAVFTALLIAAAISPELGGLRYLFAPLLVFTHPVNLFYAAVAVLSGSVLAALGLDRLLASEAPLRRLREDLSGWVGALCGVLLLGVALKLFPDAEPWQNAHQWRGHLIGAVQALVALALAGWMLASTSPGRRRNSLLFGLVLLDLVLLCVRFHAAVPSQPIDLKNRVAAVDVEVLRDGYLDITDLADLHDFQYSPEAMLDLPRAELERDAVEISSELAHRRWPVHLGHSTGIRGLAGRTRMPTARSTLLIRPLADALMSGGPKAEPLESVNPPALAALFAEGGLGRRVMRLYGIHVAVGAQGVVTRIDDVVPRCYSPDSMTVVAGPDALRERLLGRELRTRGPALLERPLASRPRRAAQVSCAGDGPIKVVASDHSVVVVRERFHRGWRVQDEDGTLLDTFPVNGVHTGVEVPPGSHVLHYRFEAPGVTASLKVASIAWLLIALLLAAGLRTPSWLPVPALSSRGPPGSGQSGALLFAALVSVLYVHFAGLVNVPGLSSVSHRVMGLLLPAGWTLDETLRSPAGLLGLVIGLGALALVVRRWESGLPVRALAQVSGVLEAIALLLVCGFAALLDGLSMAVLLIGTLGARLVEDGLPLGEVERTPASVPMGERLYVHALALCSAIFAANLLATHSTGTLYEFLGSLDSCPPGWASRALPGVVAALAVLAVLVPQRGRWSAGLGRRSAVVVLAAAAVLGARWLPELGLGGALTATAIGLLVMVVSRTSLRALPIFFDPLTAPIRWPAALSITATLAAGMLAINLLAELPSCADSDVVGVTRLGDECAAFDLAASAPGIAPSLAVVQREQGRIRVFARDEQGRLSVSAMHDVQTRRGAPEEIVALPDAGRFLVTSIPEDFAEQSTTLLDLPMGEGGRLGAQIDVPCWVSSTLWNRDTERLLLGCEASPHLYEYDPITRKLDQRADFTPSGTLGDVEDLSLQDWGPPLGRRLYSVSLSPGHRLRELDASSGELTRHLDVGGFSYAVVGDPQRSELYISRFYESSVLVVDAWELRPLRRLRASFGVRAIASLPSLRVLATTSMFHNHLDLRSLDDGRLLRRLRLGGQNKSLELGEDGRSLLLSTSCGTYEVDVEEVLAHGDSL